MNLEQQVKHLDKHYRDGNALVSDKEFDKLEKQLLAINPDSDYFTNKNALPLPSLEKDPIEDFIDGLPKNTDIFIEPKIDGCAVAIEYRNGKIHHAITRKGKDITDKMIRIRTVPLTVPTKDTIQVRGELYAQKECGSISQRMASGYIRSKSLDPNPKLTFCAFQIINAKLDHVYVLQYLEKLNFETPIWIYTNIRLLEEYKTRYEKGQLEMNNLYPTDGIVVKIDDYKLQQTRSVYWQIAIKHYA